MAEVDPHTVGGPRALSVRAVRHALITTAIVLAVCTVVIVLSAIGYARAGDAVAGLTARASGKIVAAADGAVQARWTAADGTAHTVRVSMAIELPKVGTGTDIAYDPADPDRALVPGAQVLADGERATGGLVFGLLVVVGVLLAGAWRVLTRARLLRRPRSEIEVRRVRVQRGLITRSWLELADESAWIPVYYDPVLVSMPSPVTVRAHGDVRSDRLVAVEFAGTVLFPSGPVVRAEPRGRRTDNPTQPDDTARDRAVSSSGLGRQLRLDGVAFVAAPLVGLLWAYVDRSGFSGWLGATAVTASLALWLWSWRGSDPS